MVDTVRTEEQILALFADNTTGDISAQDARDMIVSVFAETRRDGFMDYNDTATATTPITLVDNVWTPLTNDGLGAFSNDTYKPAGVAQLLDTVTGAFDFSELSLGDSVLIRNDFVVTQSQNNSLLSMRYTLGTGAGAYSLETVLLTKFDGSAGSVHRLALGADYLYMGDTNTRDNPVTLEVKLENGGSVINNGSVIQVLKR